MLHQKKVKVIENFYFSLSSWSPVHYAKQALSWAAAARWAVIHFQYVGGPRCQCTQGIKFKSLIEYGMLHGKMLPNVHFHLKLRAK